MPESTATDQLLPATCQAIVATAAAAIQAEPPGRVAAMRIPGGPEVGRQITIDATEPGGLRNICRLSLLGAELAPAGEAVRIEYEYDKQSKFGPQRVYSVQSVRRRGGELVLLENFLAASPEAVREVDFRPITSEAYARATVLRTLQDWTQYRAWQLKAGSAGR